MPSILTLSAIIVVGLVLGTAAWTFGLADAVLKPGPLVPVRWASLTRPTSPNTYLTAPSDFTAAMVDEAAPVFPGPVDELQTRWHVMIATQPRVEKKGEQDGGLQVDYVQRTRWMRFPDWITVRFIPANGGSTLAVYSRSVYGYGDMGVNKARVRRWIAALLRFRGLLADHDARLLLTMFAMGFSFH